MPNSEIDVPNAADCQYQVDPTGGFSRVNVIIESAAPLIKWTNPDALSSPQPGTASGFVQCVGHHSQNLAAFISGVLGFTGKLVMKGNDFQTVSGRTQVNMSFASSADIYCDDESLGLNFLAPLGGITGGIVHFSHRLILSVSNLAAQSLPNATQTTLKYQTLISSGDLVRFQAQYSAATGIFTVPTGGLKNVQIICHQNTGTISSGELYLQINGVIKATCIAVSNAFSQLIFNTPQLVAGDLIKIVLYNVASGAQTAGSSDLDFFHIFASN